LSADRQTGRPYKNADRRGDRPRPACRQTGRPSRLVHNDSTKVCTGGRPSLLICDISIKLFEQVKK
ncbi:MAG: hypothetical protein FWG68_08560, partial [Defluviitaleaceae bacterium]|nr:hypothetical protein [Defluviitaleaceae bacterium]